MSYSKPKRLFIYLLTMIFIVTNVSYLKCTNAAVIGTITNKGIIIAQTDEINSQNSDVIENSLVATNNTDTTNEDATLDTADINEIYPAMISPGKPPCLYI